MRKIDLDLLDEFEATREAPVEWFLPELRSAMHSKHGAEELGLRNLLEFPEAAVAPKKPWRRSGPKSGLRRLRPKSVAAHHPPDPDWPDAA